ncbi:hypothetical protein [Pedobacter arcticus]|uniref:hypothetical protein n=1 Tax=Pedobacter arcticus TaxID=752140 RepID=UPI0012B5171F|nr:hypothetical protein [Pedobacter arcticus]
MRIFFLYALFCVMLSSCTKAQTKEQVFEKVWKAVGGKSKFDKSRYFQFDFAPERGGKAVPARKHLWDRYSGDYRLETSDASGKKTIVLFNVNTKAGTVYVDNVLQQGTEADQILKKAYGAFINDTYWLMVPLKLQDEGVNTTRDADETVDGALCNVIHLNFDKVGLTPGDQYWLYVNDKTGEIIRWKFLLQKQPKPSVFNWMPYQDLGNGLKLSTRKVNIDGKSAINYPVAKVLKKVDKNIFLKP